MSRRRGETSIEYRVVYGGGISQGAKDADEAVALAREAGDGVPQSRQRTTYQDEVTGWEAILDPEEVDRACAWAEYRKDYGVDLDEMNAAHKAFLAGWEAAREGDQSGPLR